jgi:hypothetical protein
MARERGGGEGGHLRDVSEKDVERLLPSHCTCPFHNSKCSGGSTQ